MQATFITALVFLLSNNVLSDLNERKTCFKDSHGKNLVLGVNFYVDDCVRAIELNGDINVEPHLRKTIELANKNYRQFGVTLKFNKIVDLSFRDFGLRMESCNLGMDTVQLLAEFKRIVNKRDDYGDVNAFYHNIIDDPTLGYANLNSICDKRTSFMLYKYLPTIDFVTFQHELGHLFGVRHKREGIMAEIISTDNYFSSEAVVEICRNLKSRTSSSRGQDCNRFEAIPQEQVVEKSLKLASCVRNTKSVELQIQGIVYVDSCYREMDLVKRIGEEIRREIYEDLGVFIGFDYLYLNADDSLNIRGHCSSACSLTDSFVRFRDFRKLKAQVGLSVLIMKCGASWLLNDFSHLCMFEQCSAVSSDLLGRKFKEEILKMVWGEIDKRQSFCQVKVDIAEKQSLRLCRINGIEFNRKLSRLSKNPKNLKSESNFKSTEGFKLIRSLLFGGALTML